MVSKFRVLRSLNPYSLQATRNGYKFFTDFNFSYYAYFTQTTNYFSKTPELNDKIYDFGFEKNWSKESTYDSRVEQTVISILDHFFEKNPEKVLMYICDGSDGFEKQRYKLFNIWFFRHSNEDIIKINFDFREIGVCGAMLISEKNPFKSIIAEAFFREFE